MYEFNNVVYLRPASVLSAVISETDIMNTTPLIQLALHTAILSATVANCNIPLNTDDRTKGCFATTDASDEGSFVCDVSASWMHHVGGSSVWYPATPPKGTGIHEYVAYRGDAPCSENGKCSGCASPGGEVVCSVKIDAEDCAVEESNPIMIRKNDAFIHATQFAHVFSSFLSARIWN